MAAGDLCSVTDVRTRMEITSTATDTLIQVLITGASALISNRYQRDFAPVASRTQRYPVQEMEDGYVVDLAPYDIRTPSSVKLHPELGAGATTLVQDTDYTLLPVGSYAVLGTYNALKLSRFVVVISTFMLRFGYANVDVAGVWGPAAVPADVNLACAETVASWMDRAIAQYNTNELMGDGRDLRPDRFASWGIPAGAHKVLSQYARFPAGVVA